MNFLPRTIRRPSGTPLEDTAAHDIDLVRAATEALQKDLVDPLDKEVRI